MTIRLSPDAREYWRMGPIVLNATIVFTWAVMALLVVGSWLVTRRLEVRPERARWQSLLEAAVSFMRAQIRDLSQQDPLPYLPFIGTLFLFISVSNLLAPVPGYEPPTGSLSTSAALAICVFVAVPAYNIAREGLVAYLRHFIEPTPFILPFQIISEVSRTIALAVRLFGNVLSATLLASILLSLVPLVVPTVLDVLGLVIGQIQAYIFAVLALVYIVSASRAQEGADISAAGEGAGEAS